MAVQGTSVIVITKGGDKFEGIFSGSVPDSNETHVTLSMTTRIYTTNGGQTNGVTEQDPSFVGSGPDFTMMFNMRDVADLAIPELSVAEAVKTQNGKRTLIVKHYLRIRRYAPCMLATRSNVLVVLLPSLLFLC